MELLQSRWDEGKFVCIGLDSDFKKLPGTSNDPWSPRYRGIGEGVFEFNRAIVNATADLVCAYKPNLAFYRGSSGKTALKNTIDYIHRAAPGVPVILDPKRGDIGNTNDGYVDEDFGWCEADAVTVNPYFGQEAMESFLGCIDKGIIVLVRTSNPGRSEIQDLPVMLQGDLDKLFDGAEQVVPLYQVVARRVARHWNYNGNCVIVVGATGHEELAKVRKLVGDIPILIPGIGAQGGDLEATVKAGANSRGQGMIINNSRAIIFASDGKDFAEAARAATQKMHDGITAALAA